MTYSGTIATTAYGHFGSCGAKIIFALSH